ncbi:hypothetical protein E2C01_029815 [Portunus trituberculatus]|uniref:Uncharacterized protein n=1 Tax=Portunus trituberculatus TaxID=210409 RepID=A0A5B7ETF6_PORTR|nr:hypothetical protein [Portunus trituberculatus]
MPVSPPPNKNSKYHLFSHPLSPPTSPALSAAVNSSPPAPASQSLASLGVYAAHVFGEMLRHHLSLLPAVAAVPCGAK